MIIPDTMKHEFLIRCAEEVVQGSLAVKWVFASSMNFTASFLRQVGQTAVSSETLLDTHQFERTSIQVCYGQDMVSGRDDHEIFGH